MTAPARSLIDPFDVMRATRALAPHDPKLNDVRWLMGESLRRLHHRAQRDKGARPAPGTGVGRRGSIDVSEVARRAREKLAAVEACVGPADWPILTRIVIEGAGVRECRALIPEIVTPWRADAVINDSLRVALDAIRLMLGVRP